MDSGGSLKEFLKKAHEAQTYASLEGVRNDICKFVEYTQVDEKGQHLVLAGHHREWLKIIWEQIGSIVEPGKWPEPEKTDLLLFAPRNHGKTTLMVALLQFILGKNPRLRVKYVSRNQDIAVDVVGQVKNNIERNPRVCEVFPHLREDPRGTWTGSALDVLKVDADGEWDQAALGIKDASIEAYGVTAPITGGRADIIIFDDIIGSREAIHEPGRLEKIAKAFYMDWLNISGKRHIVIGTPWTPNDILAQLSQNEDWIRWRKPAIDKNGEPLWPAERPIKWLMAQKKKIGPVAFALQYMLEGIRPKDEWWTQEILDKAKDYNTRFGQIPVDWREEDIQGIVVGFDPAASLNRSGSYSCVFAIVYDKYKRKCPIRIERLRGQPRDVVDKLIDMLVEIDDTLTRKVDVVTVETNATQQAFVDLANIVCELKKLELKIPIVSAFTGGQKWNPEVGLPRMAGEFDAGKWIIPYKSDKHIVRPDGTEWQDPLHECHICSWVNELLHFGEPETTTDMVMGSWLASQAIDKQVIGDLPVGTRQRRVNVTNVNWGNG